MPPDEKWSYCYYPDGRCCPITECPAVFSNDYNFYIHSHFTHVGSMLVSVIMYIDISIFLF